MFFIHLNSPHHAMMMMMRCMDGLLREKVWTQLILTTSVARVACVAKEQMGGIGGGGGGGG